MIRDIRQFAAGTTIVLSFWAIQQCPAQVVKQASASLPVTRVLKLSSPANPESLVREDHPLYPTYVVAQDIHRHIQQTVEDYTCLLVKRERIDGELQPYEYIYVKFRSGDVSDKSGTFGVYMKYLAPKKVMGQEALYVPGQNDGDILAHKPGRRTSLDVSLDPNGSLAMRDSRYPITEFGIENLTRRLIEAVRDDMRNPECEVNVYHGAKVDERTCTAYEVKHELQQSQLKFHLARVFVDDELQVPVRYVAYDWPTEPGGELPVMEEYTYRDLKLNVGLSDEDFRRSNPNYGFRKEG
jgi:hypothetical protein